MFVRWLKDCEEFVAGDGSLLRELLHPDKADTRIHYSLAHATVAKGQATRSHRLKTCEVYYILEGRGLMHTNEESLAVGAGAVVYIPLGVTQYIENTGGGELKFLCIVDPAWRKEDELVLSSER